MFTNKQKERFWEKVKKSDSCWLWTGCEGQCTINAKRYKVHRVSWMIHYGSIPENKDVKRKCKNRSCVNPEHLFLADKTNVSDTRDLKTRFFENVKKTKGCWLWSGNLNTDGYGVLTVKNKKPKQQKAHRLSYEIHKGKIPKGLIICHKCNNPSCVNPKHLYAGTHKQNSRDMVVSGHSQRGEKHPQSVLTKEKVIEIRRKYFSEKLSYQKLSKLFSVSPATIGLIIRRNTWNWF
jgi:hypothetical protein